MTIKLWDKKSSLIYANGELKTADEVKKDYGFSNLLKTVIEVIETVDVDGVQVDHICAIHDFSILKNNFRIDTTLSDEEAFKEVVKTMVEMAEPKPPQPDALEAKVDYLIMMS